MPSKKTWKERGRTDSRARCRGGSGREYGFPFIGIDGEGTGRSPHLYTLLGAQSENGEVREWVENSKGLSTVECLEFILSLPKRNKIFAFSFKYDLTKILQNVDDSTLFFLMRPELRQRTSEKSFSPSPVFWKAPSGEWYELNMQATKFSVAKCEGEPCGSKAHKKKRAKNRRTVWDVFKFYASKFTTALEAWKVGEPEKLANMRRMKDLRSEFDKQSPDEIRQYCLDECQYLAQLVRKLVSAHEAIGYKLKTFYGAGSTASLVLKDMNIADKRGEQPDQMKEAIASAFFGGRFELSVQGSVEEKVWEYDISSAYPYQCRFLPCLEHGRWERVTKRKSIDGVRAALVHYALGPLWPGVAMPWGPFPFRLDDGCIAFPATSGGGWLWRDEFLAGERLFPHVEFREAWVLRQECECPPPFGRVPALYCERLRLGKEGPGIVLKLGMNSIYGKLAQSVGTPNRPPPFQSWVWAGMITSGTRAQILDMLGLHTDRANLLGVATDGIVTRERLKPAPPRDTATFGAVNDKGERANKPLGGWEESEKPGGVFFSRPGIYSRLHPTEADVQKVRARGIGRGSYLKYWSLIHGAWTRGEKAIVLPSLARFCGIKSSLSVSGLNSDKRPEVTRAASYGEWVEREMILSFSPLPKRECAIRKPGDAFDTLLVRRFDRSKKSMPYDRAVCMQSPDARLLRWAELEMSEQPDGGDFCEYEDADNG